MTTNTTPKNKQRFLVLAVSWLVGLYGAYDISATLLEQFMAHRLKFLNSFYIDLHLLLGIGFIYLSILLAKRKRNAFIVAIGAFIFMMAEGLSEQLIHSFPHHLNILPFIRLIVMPLLGIGALVLTKDEFKVKSDQTAFRNAVILAVFALIITAAYGTAGFMLMDRSDFHQEIGFTSALHHTIDQFDITTNSPLKPYTHRAKLFMDSLSFISTASVAYVALALFLPVRARLIDQATGRERMRKLLDQYGAPSEEFFKIWPHDKHYFFSSMGDAGLAYTVKKGIALVLADPVGNKASYAELLSRFQEMCWANDWSPSLIHVDNRFKDFYKDNGYQLQLIGQEAVVDIDKFVNETAKNKHFRNIRNRFNRENYTVELLEPPHHKAVVDRLKTISDQWLRKPGRAERGFVMGYYSDEYIQQCRIVIVRDAAQTIQAFMNLIPSDGFNHEEATYDMLRATEEAPPNINDFLIYELLRRLREDGYRYFNLGLCPLVGLDETNDSNSLIGNVLRFAYVNGDHFYSFSGLHRFKDKFEPAWEDRFIAYKGGVRGFTRLLNALLSAMKAKV